MKEHLTNSSVNFKYKEDEYLEEALKHIEKTYSQHYANDSGTQAIDLIMDSGRGEDFCIGNAIKYLSRYGKKNGHNQQDLQKAIHYILFAMYAYEQNKKKQN